MSISSATARAYAVVGETLTLGVDDDDSDVVVSHDSFFPVIDLVSIDSADAVFKRDVALVGGAKTLDLSALDATGEIAGGGSQDWNGKKIVLMILKNPVGNSNITIGEGAANGFEFTTGDNWTITLEPGEILFRYTRSQGPTIVTNTNDEIDISGTGTESLQVLLVAADA